MESVFSGVKGQHMWIFWKNMFLQIHHDLASHHSQFIVTKFQIDILEKYGLKPICWPIIYKDREAFRDFKSIVFLTCFHFACLILLQYKNWMENLLLPDIFQQIVTEEYFRHDVLKVYQSLTCWKCFFGGQRSTHANF